MPRTREQIQRTLQRWLSKEDNPWTVWYGDDEDNATQLLNKDGSNAYTRWENVNKELLAMQSEISLVAELYQITWLHPNITDEPDVSTGWWLSSDGGVNKKKVTCSHKELGVKQAFWHIFLKRG